MIAFDIIIHGMQTFPPETADPSGQAERARRIAAIQAELIASMRLIRCEASGRLAKRGVSMTHMHLLWLLNEHRELAMSRVAEVLDVSPANATGLVDRMEERGLVERLRVPDDRRIVLVRLADGGREAIDEMETMRMDLAEAVLQRFDAEQLARLESALHDFHDAVRAETGALPARGSACSAQQ